jgi:GNAT superfamily N-acetyltransferase
VEGKMKITKIEDNNKVNFMDLLLLADEELKMIEKYLHRGEMFALYDDDLKSVCVVTQESDDVCELKNIATYEKWHGKGYGSKLLNHILSYYKGKYTTMLVGTGDIPWIIQFYQKNGFRISHRVKNFFTDNYEHPIFEDGVQLIDMVYLSKSL